MNSGTEIREFGAVVCGAPLELRDSRRPSARLIVDYASRHTRIPVEGLQTLAILATFASTVWGLGIIWPAFGHLLSLIVQICVLYIQTGIRS